MDLSESPRGPRIPASQFLLPFLQAVPSPGLSPTQQPQVGALTPQLPVGAEISTQGLLQDLEVSLQTWKWGGGQDHEGEKGTAVAGARQCLSRYY